MLQRTKMKISPEASQELLPNPNRITAVSGTRSRSIINGNFNIWWLMGAALSLWFTVGKGLPLLAIFNSTGKPWSAFVHILAASIISWICLWNLFHTPSHGPIYKLLHVWLGRISLIVGTISVVLGYAVVWYFEYSSFGPSPFGIGISIGGALQTMSMFSGYYCIRLYLKCKQDSTASELILSDSEKERHRQEGLTKKMAGYMTAHKAHMTFFFFGGCLIPAFIRFPALTDTEAIFGEYWPFYCWILPIFAGSRFLKALEKRSFV